MDTQELVTVYTVNNQVEGELIANALRADGIRCVLDGGGQAGLAGVLEIRLQVAALDADKARKIIMQEHDAHKHGQTSPKTWKLDKGN